MTDLPRWKRVALDLLPVTVVGLQAGALIMSLPDDWNLDPEGVAFAALEVATEQHRHLLAHLAALREAVAERAVPLTFRPNGKAPPA